MTKKDKDLLLFHANEKACIASKMMHAQQPDSLKSHFYHGQFMAFNEIYSMITNIKADDE